MPESDGAEVTFQGVSPYLFYEDLAAALEYLTRVFGFTEDVRFVDPDGVVAEAEMLVGDTRIMMGGRGAGPDEGPGQLLIVHVTDVDAHFERVIRAGISAESPVDQPFGPRTYTVVDPWGYRWNFWQWQPGEVTVEDGWRVIRS